MKKIYFTFIGFIIFIFSSNWDNKFTERQSKNSLGSCRKITIKGYTENVGTAGLLHGVIGDYICSWWRSKLS